MTAPAAPASMSPALDQMTRRLTSWSSPITPRRAVALATVTLALSLVVDAFTSAESASTLGYMVPIALGTWYASRRTGYAFVVLSAASSFVADVAGPARNLSLAFFALNNGVELVLFVVFCHLIATVRERLQLESKLRMSAIDQLRHSERLNTLGKLTSGLAHELGTPLNVISGWAEMIQSGELDEDGVRTSAETIGKQTERMSRIIRSLLDFSRRSPAEVTSQPVRALCEEIVTVLRPLAKRRQATVTLVGPELTAKVSGSDLQQILGNLVTNALDAMSDGGTVTITVSKTMAKSEAGRATSCLLLTVEDDGSGISPETLPHVFDPFFTTKPIGQGTGLGLSVVFGIVRDQGGWIDVESTVGQGTRFNIHLPQ